MRPRCENPTVIAREVAERGVRAAVELARVYSDRRRSVALSELPCEAEVEVAAVRALAADLMNTLGLPRSKVKRSQRREEAARLRVAEVLNSAFDDDEGELGPYLQPGTFAAQLSEVAAQCPPPRRARATGKAPVAPTNPSSEHARLRQLVTNVPPTVDVPQRLQT